MCTISFIPNAQGFCLAMNRDELLTRVAGLAPAVFERKGSRGEIIREPFLSKTAGANPATRVNSSSRFIARQKPWALGMNEIVHMTRPGLRIATKAKPHAKTRRRNGQWASDSRFVGWFEVISNQ